MLPEGFVVERASIKDSELPDRLNYAVEFRGHGRFAVLEGPRPLGDVYHEGEGEFVSEPRPSNRSESFIAATRYDFEHACKIAKELATGVRRSRPREHLQARLKGREALKALYAIWDAEDRARLPSLSETLAYLEAHRDWHPQPMEDGATEWCGPDDEACSTLSAELPASFSDDEAAKFVDEIVKCVMRVDGDECYWGEAIRRVKEQHEV